MDNKRIILQADNLSKTFSNESVQQHVLKNLNLSIYKGDFTVIMGNSGSGKSTLMYALSGWTVPALVRLHITSKVRVQSKYPSTTTISLQYFAVIT